MSQRSIRNAKRVILSGKTSGGREWKLAVFEPQIRPGCPKCSKRKHLCRCNQK